jgi:Immunity protein Imm5
MALQKMIEEGLLLVHAEPQHDLKLGFRCRLLSAFDEINGPTRSRSGHSKRVKLATLSVEKVLPLWDSCFPSDRSPYLALELAKKLLAGTISATAATRETSRLWAHCDDLIFDHQDDVNPIMVGYGAVQALREALSETHFGCENVNDGSTDLDVEPHDWDASFYAAIAYSRGAPWESSSDKQKRFEFWTWWLTSAVSDATND